MLIAQALENNSQGVVPSHGLQGSKGIDYGPLPLLFYQLALALLPSLFWVALAKSFLITAGMTVSVVSFLRLFPRVPKVWGIVPFLSPYLWFASRDLWDNSFLLPLSSLSLVSYLWFLRNARLRSLACAWFLAVLAVLVHLMALPLVGAMVLHLVWFKRAWLRANSAWVAVLALGSGLAIWPYFSHLRSLPNGSGGIGWRTASFFFSLLGARTFTSLALEYFLGWGWFWGSWTSWVALVSIGLSFYAFIPTFFGIGLSVVRAIHLWEFEQMVGAFYCFVLAGQMALLTSQGLVSHPHYYNGVWFVFWGFLVWGQSSLEHTRQSKWWQRAGRLYLVALGVSGAIAAGGVILRSGNRELRYGTTLRNQLRLVESLNCFAPGTPLLDERVHSVLLPFQVLIPFAPCKGVERKASRLSLRYLHPEAKSNGEVILVPIE